LYSGTEPPNFVSKIVGFLLKLIKKNLTKVYAWAKGHTKEFMKKTKQFFTALPKKSLTSGALDSEAVAGLKKDINSIEKPEEFKKTLDALPAVLTFGQEGPTPLGIITGEGGSEIMKKLKIEKPTTFETKFGGSVPAYKEASKKHKLNLNDLFNKETNKRKKAFKEENTKQREELEQSQHSSSMKFREEIKKEKEKKKLATAGKSKSVPAIKGAAIRTTKSPKKSPHSPQFQRLKTPKIKEKSQSYALPKSQTSEKSTSPALPRSVLHMPKLRNKSLSFALPKSQTPETQEKSTSPALPKPQTPETQEKSTSPALPKPQTPETQEKSTSPALPRQISPKLYRLLPRSLSNPKDSATIKRTRQKNPEENT